MIIVKPEVSFIHEPKYFDILKTIELAGRTCYKSEDKITETSAEDFVRRMIKSGHTSVIEHAQLSFKVICDRAISQQIVRHRIGSYSQESTRYCSYSGDKFDSQIQVIMPYRIEQSVAVDSNSETYREWRDIIETAEKCYMRLLELGLRAEDARSVLPLCLKTELVMTYNMRQLRHFLTLRLSPGAQMEIKIIAEKILNLVYYTYPVFVEDLWHKYMGGLE